MLRRYAGFLFALLAIGGIALTLGVRPEADADRFNADAAQRARHLALQARALDSARWALLKTSAKTLVYSTRYKEVRDSVFVPVTRAETVAVLDRLPRFLETADSLHAACTSLVESCAAFRVRTESSLAGLTVDRDAWKARAEPRVPSRWRELAVRVGIAVVAFKLGAVK